MWKYSTSGWNHNKKAATTKKQKTMKIMSFYSTQKHNLLYYYFQRGTHQLFHTSTLFHFLHFMLILNCEKINKHWKRDCFISFILNPFGKELNSTYQHPTPKVWNGAWNQIFFCTQGFFWHNLSIITGKRTVNKK